MCIRDSTCAGASRGAHLRRARAGAGPAQPGDDSARAAGRRAGEGSASLFVAGLRGHAIPGSAPHHAAPGRRGQHSGQPGDVVQPVSCVRACEGGTCAGASESASAGGASAGGASAGEGNGDGSGSGRVGAGGTSAARTSAGTNDRRAGAPGSRAWRCPRPRMGTWRRRDFRAILPPTGVHESRRDRQNRSPGARAGASPRPCSC